MMDIYVVRDDWTEEIREASKLEMGFCLSEGVEILKTTEYNVILERYQQDFIMIKRLSEVVDPERRKVLTDLAEENLREIKAIEAVINSKQKGRGVSRRDRIQLDNSNDCPGS